MIWRPHSAIRPIAIAAIRRCNELLAMEVRDDAGILQGWRPLGGTIEFGERAAEAVKRELLEELGVPITEPRLLTVLESHYHHHDTPGHEIVFVFEAAFIDPDAYRRDRFEVTEGDVIVVARWIDLGQVRDGRERLFPAGLIEAL